VPHGVAHHARPMPEQRSPHLRLHRPGVAQVDLDVGLMQIALVPAYEDLVVLRVGFRDVGSQLGHVLRDAAGIMDLLEIHMAA
jgi:hypothetical protein